jgi:hypothetical protein
MSARFWYYCGASYTRGHNAGWVGPMTLPGATTKAAPRGQSFPRDALRSEVLELTKSFLIFLAIAVVGLGLPCAASAQQTSGPEAQPPADAMLVEAETMQCDGAAWEPATYRQFSNWSMYRYPSGLAWLTGAETGEGGAATTTVDIRRAASYRIWVRNLDAPQAPFALAVIQDGKIVAEGEFSEKTERAPEKEDAEAGWASGPMLFAWWHVDAALNAGPCTLQLTRAQPSAGGASPVVDCIAFTTDLGYTPRIRDFQKPLYIRLVMGPTHNRLGGAMYFHGRIDFAPFLVAGDFINKDGLFHTSGFNGILPETFLHAGVTTPWMNIAPYLDQRSFNRMRFEMLSTWYVHLPDSDFTIEMSYSPDKPPFKRFHREGKGSGIALLINAMKPEESYSNIEGSARNLEIARAVPKPKWGKQPTLFPLLTGLCEYDIYDPDIALRQDLQALRELGLTGTDASYDGKWLQEQGLRYQEMANFCYHLVKEPGCLSQPNPEAIRQSFSDAIRDFYNPDQDVLFIRLMDEFYSVDLEHMEKCAACTARFREYLKAQGLQPADLVDNLAVEPGKDPWEAIRPTRDKSKRRLYYYSVRCRSQIVTDFMKTVTDIVGEIKPGLRTAANTSLEVTFWKNMLTRGVDLFSIYRSNALTYGHAEDANSFPPSGQTSCLIMDTLRSACKYNGQPYGTYVIGTAPGWDIEAKAFAEVGHGCSFLHFYDYGPYHAASSDPQSQRPDFMPALKEVCYAIGSAEEDLVGAKPAPTKIALLYAHSTDVWTDTSDVPYMSNSGTERVDLYLLLRHLGYPIDVITEDDVLEGRAEGYAGIFMLESHLKDGVLARLLDWVNRGGFLYAGAGSARFNQFNEPTNGLEQIGLKRDEFVFKAPSGYWPYDLGVEAKVAYDGKEVDAAGGYQKPGEDSAGRVALRFTDGTPCAVELPHGNGRVLYVGFFPGTSYVRGASIPLLREQAELRAQLKPYVTFCSTHYQPEYRELVASLLKPLQYTPAVRVSNPLVEGCLLAGKRNHVLSLANWTGAKQRIEVAVDLPYQAGRPRSAINALRDVKPEGRTVTFRMELGPGDIVTLPPK